MEADASVSPLGHATAAAASSLVHIKLYTEKHIYTIHMCWRNVTIKSNRYKEEICNAELYTKMFVYILLQGRKYITRRRAT